MFARLERQVDPDGTLPPERRAVHPGDDGKGGEEPVSFPPIEMVFGNDTTVESRIATFKAKWSVKYRESRGIENMVAQDLSKSLIQRLSDVAVRTYRAAGLRDYGRIDVRLAHDDAIYVVEANPNPYLADGEDLAWAAEVAG